jgi:hypothetical protein
MNIFKQLNYDLVNLYNPFISNPNQILTNFTEGVIILIPKIKNINTVGDCRPVSLLNCDYKLFAKILANRIQNFLPDLIGAGQSECIPGMFCVENLIQLWNLIAASSVSNRIKFAVMSIDLEKTFHRVTHEYLWRCLEKIKFIVTQARGYR